MSYTYTKISPTTLGAIETISSKVCPIVNYDYAFLKKQLLDIQAKKDSDNALRDAELATVNALIAAADGLGIAAIIPAVAPAKPII